MLKVQMPTLTLTAPETVELLSAAKRYVWADHLLTYLQGNVITLGSRETQEWLRDLRIENQGFSGVSVPLTEKLREFTYTCMKGYL